MQDFIDLVSPFWLALAVGLIALLSLSLLFLRRRRQRREGLGYALTSAAVDRIEDVFLPDGMGGEIHVEQLLLTIKGILVINVKQFKGVVFASDRMDEWTVIGPKGRSAFPNPLGDLYDRVAAVRQLVRDVNVTGYLLFPADADFSKGRPKDVLLPVELRENFARPPRSEVKTVIERFATPWENIRGVARPAKSRPPRLS